MFLPGQETSALMIDALPESGENDVMQALQPLDPAHRFDSLFQHRSRWIALLSGSPGSR